MSSFFHRPMLDRGTCAVGRTSDVRIQDPKRNGCPIRTGGSKR